MVLYFTKVEISTVKNGLEVTWQAFNPLINFGGYGSTQEEAENDFITKFNSNEGTVSKFQTSTFILTKTE